MRSRKNKIPCLFLALTMLLGVMSGASLSAFAAENGASESLYLFADNFSGAGVVMSEDAQNGVDPAMPRWIGNLYKDAMVTVSNVPFTEQVEYLTLYSRYNGTQVDIYADSVSAENKIATVGNNRPNYRGDELPFFEAVSVPLTKRLDGNHDLIFVVKDGTDLGAFRLLTAADIMDMQTAPVNASEAAATWKAEKTGTSVGGLGEKSVLIYELVNMKNATGIDLTVSGGSGSIEIKAYNNAKNRLVKLAELNVAPGSNGPAVLNARFEEILYGAHTLYISVESGSGITLDSIQLDNSFALMDAPIYNDGGKRVSLRDVDFAWEPGKKYNFMAETAGITEATPIMMAALFDSDNRVLAAGASAPGKLSVTLTMPENANDEGTYTMTYIWDADTRLPLVPPVKTAREITIGCIGDSITEGAVGGPYVGYIQKEMPEEVTKVENFGKGGATVNSTISGHAYLEDALNAKCSVYTIMLGTNEVNNRGGWTKEQYEQSGLAESYKAEYRALIDSLLDANPDAKIFLATCPKINVGDEPGFTKDSAMTEVIVPAIKEVAAEYGFEVIDLNAEMDEYVAMGGTLNAWGYGDQLHMSTPGAQKIGEFFAKELKRYLGL